MLHKEPLKTKVNREDMSIIPDAFLHYHVTKGETTYSMPIWVELDRGSELGKRMREKLTAIILLVRDQVYKDLFGVEDITVAFATLTADRRDLLRSYVSKYLSSYKFFLSMGE